MFILGTPTGHSNVSVAVSILCNRTGFSAIIEQVWVKTKSLEYTGILILVSAPIHLG